MERESRKLIEPLADAGTGTVLPAGCADDEEDDHDDDAVARNRRRIPPLRMILLGMAILGGGGAVAARGGFWKTEGVSSLSTAGATSHGLPSAMAAGKPVRRRRHPPPSSSPSSPFFDHVLAWKEMPPEASPDRYDDAAHDTAADVHDDVDDESGRHYAAAIEFCSDPSGDSYGYGPVGGCVPGDPAPLIRMKPKRFYHLTLYNNAHIDTNLHTHGLHVSGVGTVDDVTRVAKPGECLTYDYYILDDADVGTFWYHPHRHPLTTPSVYGGAYGMLIVDETVALDRFYPDHLANFLTGNEILLQFSSMYDAKLPHPVRTNRVNGRKHLELVVAKGAHYYLRVSSVVYADPVSYLEFDPPDACTVRVVAYDGVYRSEIPGPATVRRHMMTVSSRGDFAVRCARDASIHFHQGTPSEESRMVTIRLAEEEEEGPQDAVSASASPEEPRHQQQQQKKKKPKDDAHRVVVLAPALPSSPYWDANNESSTWKPRRPYYMPDLSDPAVLVDEHWRVSMDHLSFANGTEGMSVNRVAWDPDRSLRTFSLGQLVEYPLAMTRFHPYHQHINRMQVVEPGGCGHRFEEGEYFDTIVQSEEVDGCTIRTKFFDFAGRVVIHCHRFAHEDEGMMTWIDVLGGHGHGIAAGPATDCEAVL